MIEHEVEVWCQSLQLGVVKRINQVYCGKKDIEAEINGWMVTHETDDG